MYLTFYNSIINHLSQLLQNAISYITVLKCSNSIKLRSYLGYVS